jgi:hypothetical protein
VSAELHASGCVVNHKKVMRQTASPRRRFGNHQQEPWRADLPEPGQAKDVAMALANETACIGRAGLGTEHSS